VPFGGLGNRLSHGNLHIVLLPLLSFHQLSNMAAPLQIHERTYPQELASLVSNKATPPDKQIQLPLTPPTTVERVSCGSDKSAVASALQIFKQHQDHRLINPWTSIRLRPTQYDRFLDQLKQHSVLFGHVENKTRYAAPSTRPSVVSSLTVKV
jgi:hypothetical protein